VEPVYGAPPLLNRLVEKGEFPAVLTFWHYQARLKAKGLKKIIDIRDVLEQLGVAPGVPIVGWVFSEKWARANEDALRGFLRASAAAKKILAESDDEWLGLESLIKPGDNATLAALRDGYREGIPRHFGIEEVTASKNLYHILSEIGGSKLVGDSKELSPGTFWTGAIE
jgi:NitT/TauT family transport system substrate-binding protein